MEQAAMIELAEMLPPTPSALWTLASQMGLQHAVGGLPFDDPLNQGEAPWDYMPLLRMKQRYESAGFKLAVIESRPPYNLVKRGLPGRDQEIDGISTLNVKMAMHPDDPPLSPLRGIGRIMRSVDNYQRLLDLVPSPVNGITLCQGNFTLMTDDLPSVIRKFCGQKKVFFVHFRDVRGNVEKFEETWHDDGKTNLLECMRAYKEVGFEGVLRPDHVPTVAGDSNNQPGYSAYGRLYAIGYIRGLREAVYAS